MSAYIVDHATIHVLVTWLREYKAAIPAIGDATGLACHPALDMNPDEIGSALLAENVKSVNYRYKEKFVTPRYEFRSVYLYKKFGHPPKPITPIDILTIAECYEYQSCEHPEWESSWARRVIDILKDHCISHLPGYKEAPWGLTDDEAVIEK